MNERRKIGRLIPVILAGGSGTRLWPLSRSLYPKQFLPLMRAESLLVETCRRVSDASRFAPPIVICSGHHHSLLTQQLQDAGIGTQAIVLEPVARGTAAAAAVAAIMVAQATADDMLLLLASDNHVSDPSAFLAAVDVGVSAAAAGRIVMFGVAPTRKETGFGYIKVGPQVWNGIDANVVDAFVEKPDLARAEHFVSCGEYLWNSGNFLVSARTLLREFERLQPEIVSTCREALGRAAKRAGSIHLDEESLAESPSESLDRAIMERTELGAVVPLNAGWSDVGSWDALWSASSRDHDGNTLVGDAIVSDSKGSYIRSEQRLVAAIGVSDLVVIETGDAVFVAPRDCAAEAKAMVERLGKMQRPEVRAHAQVNEYWGSTQKIDEADGTLVRRVVIKPGFHLASQVDPSCGEHWIVTRGTAWVTLESEQRELRTGESISLEAQARYRLENMEKIPLQLIEVRTKAVVIDDAHQHRVHRDSSEKLRPAPAK